MPAAGSVSQSSAASWRNREVVSSKGSGCCTPFRGGAAGAAQGEPLGACGGATSGEGV